MAEADRGLTYQASGVDIDAGDRFVERIRQHVQRTHGVRVLTSGAGFAGLFALDYNGKLFRKDYQAPVLVSCTDGAGTKLKIAFATGVHNTVGIDLVAMNVNDLVCTGAEPLFFLDYFATGKLDVEVGEQVISGIAEGCRLADLALIGGETAEMPGFYAPGEYDLAGFAVGVVARRNIVDGSRILPGDTVLGLPSSGIHSNGLSLARKVLGDTPRALKRTDPTLGGTVGEALLTPTRIYVQAVRAVQKPYRRKRVLRGVCHITGGGLPGNVPRMLKDNPASLRVRLDTRTWEVPPIFGLIQKAGEVAREEMYRVFNMGLGLVMVVPPFFAEAALRRLRRLGYAARRVGVIEEGPPGLVLDFPDEEKNR